MHAKKDILQRRVVLYNSGLNLREIANIEGISHQALSSYFKYNNVSLRPSKKSLPKVKQPRKRRVVACKGDMELALKLYQEGVKVSDILVQTKVVLNTLHSHRKMAGIPIRHEVKEAKAVELYQANVKLADITSKADLCLTSLYKSLKKHNIKPSRGAGRPRNV